MNTQAAAVFFSAGHDETVDFCRTSSKCTKVCFTQFPYLGKLGMGNYGKPEKKTLKDISYGTGLNVL